MLLELTAQIQEFMQKSDMYLVPWSIFLGSLWAVNILNWICRSPLNYLSIYPRHLLGLPGIIFSPFIHQDFTHLFFNSIPLFALGLVILAKVGFLGFCWISGIIALVGGLGVWLFARVGLHLGASGVISGYFGYVLMTAYTAPSVISVLCAVLAIYYFGGIFLGIFPSEEHISWESHLFGFLGGVLCSYLPIPMY